MTAVKKAKEKRTRSMRIQNMHIPSHILLLLWAVIALFPVYIMLINSFKIKTEIYKNPFGWPRQWYWDNFASILAGENCLRYFLNTFMVCILSLFFILVLGALAAYALAHWRTGVSGALYYVLIIGMMLPIKIATIRLLQMVKAFGLIDSLLGLYPIYIAMGIPTAVFILTEFIRGLPGELYEAGYMDGAGRMRILLSVVLPLIRPALATVAIYNLIPIWNDLWFPLIFISDDSQKTILLAVTRLQGQYATDWPKTMSMLTLSSLPVILLYVSMSKQFIKGLTAGAIKG